MGVSVCVCVLARYPTGAIGFRAGRLEMIHGAGDVTNISRCMCTYIYIYTYTLHMHLSLYLSISVPTKYLYIYLSI